MSFRVTRGQQLARVSARHDGRQGGKDVEKFNPRFYRATQVALDFTLDEAKRIMDWPLLEKAVEEKIVEQLKFVRWWTANVRRAGGDQKSEESFAKVAANDSLSAAQAEKLTGMKHQREAGHV
jgi:hypothetical protein